MMCGISGASGPNSPRLSLLLMLGQLERGTLGTGLAFANNSRLHFLKEPVNPILFVGKYFTKLDPKVNAAIGHNRMPSKGRVNYVNTHPFVSCDKSFAIVHNGTTFFKKATVLRLRRNHKILGETDSEVICHLLEEYYRRHADMVTALSELADSEFSGSILVLLKDGQLFALRKGLEPVHFAVTDRNVLVASTERAIRNVTGERAEIKRLKSGQIIHVKGLDVKVHDTDHVSDFGFDFGFEDYFGTIGACDWRSYFRSAKSLRYFF